MPRGGYFSPEVSRSRYAHLGPVVGRVQTSMGPVELRKPLLEGAPPAGAEVDGLPGIRVDYALYPSHQLEPAHWVVRVLPSGDLARVVANGAGGWAVANLVRKGARCLP